MKLRQKLAVVLASAMIITAVPVTTMAKSTSEFNKVVSVVEGTKLDAASGLFLNVKVEKQSEKTSTTFFLETQDFEFNKDLYVNSGSTTKGVLTVGNATIEILSDTEARVTVSGLKADADTSVAIPVYGKVLKGNPAIIVDGVDSLVTSDKLALTATEVAGDKAYVATVGDAKNVSVEGVGTLADITIEEKVAGSFAKDASGNVEFQVKLPNRSDLVFDKTATNNKIEIEGKRGQSGKTIDATVAYGVDKAGKDDEKILVITMDAADFSATERGAIVIKNLAVKPENPRKDCSTGEVKVTLTEVAGTKADGKKEDTRLSETTLLVANVTDFGVSIKVVDDKTVELVGGKEAKEVKVKVKETAIGSLDDRRDIYFSVEGAHFDETTKATIKLNDGSEYEVEIKDGELHLDLDKIDRNKINTFDMKFKVYSDVNQDGAITLVAESKNFEEDIKTEIGKVAAPFEVKSEALTVKVGLQGQVGGKITIAETDKGMFEKGDVFYLEESKYFHIDDAKVEVTAGDLEIDKEVKDGKIKVTIKRPSDEASTITISNVDVTTNRLLPEGKFDVEIYGDAISYMNESANPGYDKDKKDKTDVITVEDFFVVGTKNTEDLPNAAAAKEIVLTIGATDYTVNGEAKKADAAAFIDANNRTMVPVKFVAEEFGKIDFNTINGVGTVTVFKDGAVLQFQNGSNIMNKNGISIPMDAKVVIKDGRTYVPFKYVADGLGINYTFDAATKSITFTNQAK